MPTDITQSDITVTIPSLGDSANIVTAFTDYHTDLAAAVAVLGRSTNTFTGDIALNGGDITTTSSTFNIANTNALTVQIGLAATSLVFGATTGQTAFRNDIVLSAGKRIILEGATNDTAETVLTVEDPTTDRTITFPDATGNVILDTATQTLTNKTLTTPIISSISNSGTVTLPTGTRTLVARDTTDTLTNKTVTGLVLSGGTTSLAPLKFTAHTNFVSTITAGAVEYDGNLFYATPKVNNTTAGRGLLQTQYSLVTIADNTQTVTGTANTDFYALNKSIYLAASQAYFVEMSIRVAHTLTYSGLGSGSATFLLKGPSGVSYKVDAQSQVDMTAIDGTTAPEFKHISSSSASRTISNPGGASDSGYSIFKWSGIVYVSSTAGNFGPAINLTSSSSYSSSFTVQAGSYCRVTPLGTYAAEINHGGWA